MNLSQEELTALKLIEEGKSNISSDVLVSLEEKNLVTGLVSTSHLNKKAYIVGLETELTWLGKKALN